MKNVIELAKRAGVWPEPGERIPSAQVFRRNLEQYATLVRNAAMEEAAQKCEELESQYFEVNGDGCAYELRNLKEPTP